MIDESPINYKVRRNLAQLTFFTTSGVEMIFVIYSSLRDGLSTPGVFHITKSL